MKKGFDKIFDRCGIVINFLTLVVILLTLLEMQAERNQIYKPTIILNNKTVCIMTDDYKPKEWEDEMQASLGSIWTQSYQSIETEMVNIGTSTALNIRVLFPASNYTEISKRVLEQGGTLDRDKYAPYSIIADEERISADGELRCSRSYLLANAQESVKIGLPNLLTPYYYMFFFSGDPDLHNIPAVKVSMEYEDVQGRKYKEEILLKAEILHYEMSSDGGGVVYFSLRAEY